MHCKSASYFEQDFCCVYSYACETYCKGKIFFFSARMLIHLQLDRFLSSRFFCKGIFLKDAFNLFRKKFVRQKDLRLCFPAPDSLRKLKKAVSTPQPTRLTSMTRAPPRRRTVHVSLNPPGLQLKTQKQSRMKRRKQMRTNSDLSLAPASPSIWRTSIPLWSSQPSLVCLNFLRLLRCEA